MGSAYDVTYIYANNFATSTWRDMYILSQNTIFQTNGSERMRITSGGNVGIGSGAPQTSLEVSGGNTYFPAKIITLSGAESTRYNGFMGLNLIGGSQLAMSFGTRSNNTDYANTLNLFQGNVLIGTTTDSGQRFQVSGGQSYFYHNTTNYDVMYIVNQSSSPYGMNITFSGAAPNNNTNNFLYFADTSGLKFRVTSSGTIASGIWNGTAIADAYIASAATWNAKQGAITLTTTGTSGVATFDGSTLNIPNYTYTLPTASTTVLGGVKVDGTSITIASGVISATYSYTLPTASSTVLGGVKIGSGVTITSGVISVSTNYQAPITLTTTGTSGVATFDGSTLNIPNYGSALSGYVPYTGATADVNLGTRALLAGNILASGSLSASLSSATSGVLNITNTGAGRIADFQNSGALVAYITNAGSIYGSSFIKSGGSSSQFLKADGSVDSSSYVPYTGASSNLDMGGYTVTASAFYESSDIRFKNVLETNPNISAIGIDVIKFTRNGSDTIRYGYSAQQVQSIVPDAVFGDNELVVNYMDVHTLKIASLENRVAELELRLKSTI